KGKPTAVLTHGANPGLVSHFVKSALLRIADDCGLDIPAPVEHRGWAELARELGVKVVHVAERDTQRLGRSKSDGEFINTWSVEGFLAEGCQPSELGWGSHERRVPQDVSRHKFGCDAAVYLERPGASVRVRSWTPLGGAFHGFLVTHCESISLADYFSIKDTYGNVQYRPTVHYAYQPCDAAILS
ncbi:homospermidine synthase, partial [Pseudomonas sp. MWU13-2625]